MENSHPIENLMKSTMENIKEMVDVNTIVGDPVESKDGTIIIPLSKVSFGFASGGSEFNGKANNGSLKYPFGGGSGAGVSVKPVAFLVIKQDTVRVLSVDQDNTYDRIVDSIPQIIDMLKGFFNNKDSKNCNKKNNKDKENQTSYAEGTVAIEEEGD
ncbi:MAG: sporulation protein [Clostridiaceae bacterium]|jgi:sporulation protein YtfJ|nr:sporulation protein [Clostridiaceae bacterium]